MALSIIGASLLVAGGLLNAMPPIAADLRKFFWGKPILQIFIGLISMFFGLGLIMKVF